MLAPVATLFRKVWWMLASVGAPGVCRSDAGPHSQLDCSIGTHSWIPLLSNSCFFSLKIGDQPPFKFSRTTERKWREKALKKRRQKTRFHFTFCVFDASISPIARPYKYHDREILRMFCDFPKLVIKGSLQFPCWNNSSFLNLIDRINYVLPTFFLASRRFHTSWVNEAVGP